ncbi:MAG: hypothetical protein QOG10_69 [Kribbellaceae bacterium]|nr:hypothetical protein [Kribbellaceae bacterium]
MLDELRQLRGVPVLVCAAEGSPLRDDQGAVDLIAAASGHRADWVAVPVDRLPPEFFRLRSGVAGAIVQKFVNYRTGLAVVGDVTAHVAASDAFRDWVRETNRGRDIWFVVDLAELAQRLTVARGSGDTLPV